MRRLSCCVALAAALASCGDAETPGAAAASGPVSATPATQPASRAPTLEDAATSAGARPFEAWVHDLQSDDETVRTAAFAALRDAGGAAVPALLARLFDPQYARDPQDPVTGLLLEQREAAISFVLARLRSGSEPEQDRAAYVLGRMSASGGFGSFGTTVVDALIAAAEGPAGTYALNVVGCCGRDAEHAVPELVRLLDVDACGSSALDAITALGPRAGAALPRLLELWTANEFERADAIRAIGALGPQAASAVPRLVAELRELRGRDRSEAVDALASIGVSTPEVLDVLRDAAKGASGYEKSSALDALDRFGDRSPAFFEALAVNADEHYRGGSVADRIAALAASEPLAARAYAEMLSRPVESGSPRNFNVVGAIEHVPAARAAIVPYLVEASLKCDPTAGSEAYETLVLMDDPAARTVALKLLPRATGEFKRWLIDGLAYGGPPDDAVMAALIAAAQDKDGDVAREAMWPLEQFGPAAASAAPVLLARLDDSDTQTRYAACDALIAMGVKDARLEPLLLARLDGNTYERGYAADGLGLLGDAGRAHIARLNSMMYSDGLESNWRAAPALGRLGAIEALIAAMRNPEAAWRGRRGFENLPPSSIDAVCGYAGDPSPAIRKAVAAWLGSVRGARAEGVLVRMLGDEDDEVAASAAKELGRFTSPSPATLLALRSTIGERSDAVVVQAALAFWKAGGDAATAGAALCDALHGNGADAALLEMGAAAAPVASRLRGFLKAPISGTAAACAVLVLKPMPCEARLAIADLGAIAAGRVRAEGSAESTAVKLRVDACALLGDVGDAAAAPDLREALLDPRRDVRDAARAALAKLGPR